MRVVLADDTELFRSLLAVYLEARGVNVVGQFADGQNIVAEVRRLKPDVVILDMGMPPNHYDEGIVAAESLREANPNLPILILSAYFESSLVRRLLEIGNHALGYLLKDRVASAEALLDALNRLVAGEIVLDETVIGKLMLPAEAGSLDALSPREREVLRLMAEGYSNLGIASRTTLSPSTVENHIRTIFQKLDINGTPPYINRRVIAVLRWLRTEASSS